ncbi:hypothetical protein F5Y18DRAFT_282261 [Xylariaceae sp. FL1019]|nr:hypothetical protein F5Y18DRAFT_282261 [Xylariaceae sp. FL1019]
MTVLLVISMVMDPEVASAPLRFAFLSQPAVAFSHKTMYWTEGRACKKYVAVLNATISHCIQVRPHDKRKAYHGEFMNTTTLYRILAYDAYPSLRPVLLQVRSRYAEHRDALGVSNVNLASRQTHRKSKGGLFAGKQLMGQSLRDYVFSAGEWVVLLYSLSTSVRYDIAISCDLSHFTYHTPGRAQ